MVCAIAYYPNINIKLNILAGFRKVGITPHEIFNTGFNLKTHVLYTVDASYHYLCVDLKMEFPSGFIQQIQNASGFDEGPFLLAHETPAPVSIRLNPNKKTNMQHGENVPWCSNAYYLPVRPAFVFDPLFHAGAYYVQEASSMFTGYLFSTYADKTKSLKILDLCAAPGGKSTLIAGLMNEHSLLVSNEVIKSRARILKENIDKWGNPNVVVSNNDPRDFSALTNFFDVIIIDAPCSGSGLFRKEPDAKNEWSEENVLHCSKRQSRILEDVIPALKQNGLLIYATCSYSEAENEQIVMQLITKGFQPLINKKLPSDFGNIVTNEYGYRFYPDKIKGEGFFVSILQKTESDNQDEQAFNKKTEPLTTSETAIISPYLKAPEELFFYKHKNIIYCIPEVIKPAIMALGNLYLIKSGIAIGEIKHNELIPDHELALSTLIGENIPRVELDEPTAIAYLRKNTIQIDTEIKGWCLVTYQQLPLGWIKVIPGRINNYYPVELRIRK